MAAGRVVVIDDDSPVRRALARLIRAAGYEVETFEDAQAYLTHGAIAQRHERCLIRGTIVNRDRLLNGVELDQNGALQLAMLVCLSGG